MSCIRLGIVGYGEFPRAAYTPILKEMPDVSVVAASARTPGTRHRVRDAFGPEIALYEDYAALLADDAVDAVILALPNSLHLASVQAAVDAGKHVFFEPPLGAGDEGVARVLDAAAASDRVVQADLELRCLPAVDLVRELARSDALGEPLMANVRLWADWGAGDRDWSIVAGDDGFFPWVACWYLDLLDCVFAAEPVGADVAGGYAMNRQLMDYGCATLTYPRGQTGLFEFSIIAAEGLEVALSLLCANGEVRADLMTGVCQWRERGGKWQRETHDCSRPEYGFVGVRESIADFVAAIRTGHSPRADLDVIRRVQSALARCTRAEKALRQATGTVKPATEE